jgi:hypothetical protein
MRVRFVRTFSGPNAERFRAGLVYDVPDDWEEKGILPTGTIVMPEGTGSIEANKDGLLQVKTMRARNASSLAAPPPLKIASTAGVRPNRLAGEYAIGDTDEQKAQSEKAVGDQAESDENIAKAAAELTGQPKEDINVEALKSTPSESNDAPTADATDKAVAAKAKEDIQGRSDAIPESVGLVGENANPGAGATPGFETTEVERPRPPPEGSPIATQPSGREAPNTTRGIQL